MPPAKGRYRRRIARVGGTALIGQRSELLVLGQECRRGHVTWGMGVPATARALDLRSLHRRVGLDGAARRRPALSGGRRGASRRGRCAARRRLIISDESTAAIDRDGRRHASPSLPGTGIAVVPITYDRQEAARDPRVITVDGGGVHCLPLLGRKYLIRMLRRSELRAGARFGGDPHLSKTQRSDHGLKVAKEGST